MKDQIPSHVHTGLWIPKELKELGLSAVEQYLLSIISSLDHGSPTYCWASNSYLAQIMELSESRISYYITKFKKMGLIEQVSFDGTKRRLHVLKSNWYLEKKENSKKDVCVKTRRQTTRKQEGRLRENTHHIIKKIHIDDKQQQQQQSDAADVDDFRKKEDPGEISAKYEILKNFCVTNGKCLLEEFKYFTLSFFAKQARNFGLINIFDAIYRYFNEKTFLQRKKITNPPGLIIEELREHKGIYGNCIAK